MRLTTSLNMDLPFVPPNGSATFFVVLHGAISVVQEIGLNGAGDLRAHLIDAQGDHQVLAGSWLNERPLSRGSYQFECPQAAPAPRGVLSPTDSPVVSLNNWPDPASPQYHSVFRLPPPNAIHHFNRAVLSLDPIAGPSPFVAPPFASTALLVLEYSLNGPNINFGGIKITQHHAGLNEHAEVLPDDPDLAVDGAVPEWWRCSGPTVWDSGSNGEVASLHIFNYPFEDKSAAHSKKEFDDSAVALGVPQVAIQIVNPGTQGASSTGGDIPNGLLPPGLHPFELGGLGNDRQAATERLVDFLRTGKYDSMSRPFNFGGTQRGCNAIYGSFTAGH